MGKYINNYQELKQKIQSLLFKHAFVFILNELLRFLIVFSLIAIVLFTTLLFENFTFFEVRTIFLSSLYILAVYILVKLFIIFRSNLFSINRLSKILEFKYPDIEDRIINSISLWRDKEKFYSKYSKLLINELLKNTLDFIHSVKTSDLYPASLNKNLRVCLFTLVFLYSGFRVSSSYFYEKIDLISHAFNEDRTKILEVKPGNAKVKEGTNLQIEVKSNSRTIPIVNVYRTEGRFEYKMRRSSVSGHYVYNIQNIEDNIRYRLSSHSNKYKSDMYNVKTLKAPYIEDVHLRLIFPGYTDKPAQESRKREIRALKGTKVILTARSNKNLSSASIIYKKSGRDIIKTMEIIDANSAQAIFTVDNQESYSIVLIDAEGIQNDNPPHYFIETLADTKPIVEFIEPVSDLEAAPDAVIDLKIKARDDISVSKIFIEYYLDMAGKSQIISIPGIVKSSKTIVAAYKWDLSKTNAVPGTVISVRAGAEDNNILSGPGTGYSPYYHIEIIAFKEIHREIYDSISANEEKLYDMLEISYNLSSYLESSNYSGAIETNKMLKELGQDIQSSYKKMIEEMRDDSYMDPASIKEFNGIEKALGHLNDKLEELSKKLIEESSSAKSTAESISEQIEKIINLSDEASKQEKMNDVVSAAQDSVEQVKDLSDILNSDTLSDADLKSAMSKLKHLLEELKTSIKELPNELPEEFINRESIKNLDIQQQKNMFEELNAALASGDIKTAKELLSSMLSSLQMTLETLSEAAEDTHKERKDKLAERAKQIYEELKTLIKTQEDIITETEAADNLARSIQDRLDLKRFEELRKAYQILKSTVRIRSHEIDKEFAKSYLYNTAKQLESIAQKEKQEWKKAKINEFIKQLKTPVAEGFKVDETILSKSKELQQKQLQLRSRTKDLTEAVKSLGHLTALMDPYIVDRLEMARLFMKNAENYIFNLELSDSIQSERQAISYLIMSQDSMEEFKQEMESMPSMGGGSSSSGTMQQQSYRSSSSRGRDVEGHVEIPERGQEISGTEFRTKILKALKSMQPGKYERLIREYFRSLSE